jgi:hypothetical protein
MRGREREPPVMLWCFSGDAMAFWRRLGEDEELLTYTSLYTREREEEEAGRRCD